MYIGNRDLDSFCFLRIFTKKTQMSMSLFFVCPSGAKTMRLLERRGLCTVWCCVLTASGPRFGLPCWAFECNDRTGLCQTAVAPDDWTSGFD